MLRRTWILWLGDGLALLLVSVIGYLTHYAGKEPFSLRWMTTFVPFCLGWALAAPAFGLYRLQKPLPAALRAVAAAFLAAPFAAWLRGLTLSAAISPVFVLVLACFAGLGLGLWRLAWALTGGRISHG